MTPTIALPTLYQEALVSFAKGKKPQMVLSDLVNQGLPEPHARALMAEALKEKKAYFRRAGFEAMIKGAGFLVLGIVITALTYSLNMPIFIVATGPILFGLISFFKGLFRAITG
ncbi:MAG: hypothetical protein ABSF22_15445 [Bryobacteraceae bacterium]|jgi:hypothetical protein